ncbi:rhodanese-like domain-containing protein [Mucilaginibacter segetis]|uniref:Rhodanese-like domain-containing protein n=1 Tax=Mucilaginibacter segetis TaxID=2793071 RepID=A0A934PSA0_9SPHI|nr:rhodanese-like domain-containing protein [Mucilaginibacter segetis]MBK0378691.1 rhodanese-like domain-containing protein [Mucilaginibacter segetis]
MPLLQISAQNLQQRLQNGEQLNLLDVREIIEYHTYNIGGINIPLSKLETNFKHIAYNKTSEIIVICSAGIRSVTAQNILTANGYQNIVNLTGGLKALQKLNIR